MSNNTSQNTVPKTYSLQGGADTSYTGTAQGAFKKMLPMLAVEKIGVIVALLATVLNAGLNLLGPFLVGYSIDTYVVQGDYAGVVRMSLILLAVYVVAFIANYVQMRGMGGVAQRVLWSLRNDLFLKLQELPLAFFNQNKAGDLISRINSDTEKVNEFFSQSLIRFAGNVFMLIGTAIFIFSIHPQLATVSMIPAVLIVIFVQLVSGWVEKINRESFRTKGLLSADIQEAITTFKVFLAFNRQDYFKTRFEKINAGNFKASLAAGYANELFTPVFEFMGNLALLALLGYGLHLVSAGQFAIGALVSFVMYITRFYDPLREMARLWATLQSSLAAWDRIGVILNLTSDLTVHEEGVDTSGKGLLEFRNVSFAYAEGKEVLRNCSFVFEAGKTYALVGPTGGGKTTTASLIARLFDPTAGTVFLHGNDIRSFSTETRTQKIGFILQEPYLFSGTVRDNLAYGLGVDDTQQSIDVRIQQAGFDALLARFSNGLDTHIDAAHTLSLGEKQMIAFMRAVLRAPDILILDEATANIDTITEKVLTDILNKLPATTTKIIIAHRLNTIKDADSIFFVNGSLITEAGSMEDAVDMLLRHARTS
jgi:ATP-binding cassette, subfamily B, bacterial